MKVLISADMEGATGVTCADDVRPGAPAWQMCRQFLVGDVNAAIRGFFDAGASEVIVNEAHAAMRNLVLEQVDPRVDVIVGSDKPFGMMEGIDRGIDAVALVGYHAAAGEPGILSHTYLAGGLVSVRLNGDLGSEGRMSALLAAEEGVPVILVTGDDVACADAADYAPDAVRVIVKTAIGRFAAACHPPSMTSLAIRDGAASALAELPRPASSPKSFTYEIEFVGTNAAAVASLIPGVDRITPRSVRFTLPTMSAAIRCFAAVTTLAAGAVDPDFQ